MTRTAEEIKGAVKEHYGERAKQAADCCGTTGYRDKLYVVDEVADLPDTVASYGCGNPTAIAGLREGEVVLDLGSGPGLDCFLAAKAVGAAGRVIGLDMTQEMLDLANANRDKLGASNVEFRKGEMESMPIDDNTVDVIISNCVINLSPDKDAVFRESHRVLKPGGRFHVSDVVLSRELSGAERDDLALWAGCASGALLESDYVARLQAAGFGEVRIDSRSKIGQKPWYSATLSAFNAADETCCGPDCCADTQSEPAKAETAKPSCC